MTSTVSIPWPDHPIGLDEWDALDGETFRRAELVEGVVVLAPSPLGSHQRVSWRLCAVLEPQLAPQHLVTAGVEVLVDERGLPTVRRPDVVVVRAEAFEARYRYGPADVLAVFEILSSGTRRVDRVMKLAEYAEAGIAHYGIVEPGPPTTLVEFSLRGQLYEPAGEHRGVAELGLGVTIDLDALR